MKRLKGRWIRNQLLTRLFHPGYLRRYFRSRRGRAHLSTTHDNAQLELYTRMLPGDFLHYGFFDDPDTAPEEISLAGLHRAQVRYGELLLEQSRVDDGPVLDVGCGMGGLLHLLLEEGFSPVGLTPDRVQITYLKEKYPGIPLLHCRFEDMPEDGYRHHFGTVINSESLQYMALEDAIAKVDTVLKPGGRWVIADYFRLGEAPEKSGFFWEPFRQRLEDGGFRIVHERDITPNICPTLAYVHMWGERIAQPVLAFAGKKMERKAPFLHYLLEEILEAADDKLTHEMRVVDPEVFRSVKTYRLLTLERA